MITEPIAKKRPPTSPPTGIAERLISERTMRSGTATVAGCSLFHERIVMLMKMPAMIAAIVNVPKNGQVATSSATMRVRSAVPLGLRSRVIGHLPLDETFDLLY